MSVIFPAATFPKGAIIGAAALMVLTFSAALAGRVTGLGRASTLPAAPVESSELRFEDRADGAVIVRGAADGRIVTVLEPNSNHFVRGTLRGLVRERKRENIGSEPPFRLSRLVDGRVTLEDPAIRRRIDLDAFGRSNVGAFSAILEAAIRIE
jgi:putative photosynthetic complex assembly protein